jgi:hypothetical protein
MHASARLLCLALFGILAVALIVGRAAATTYSYDVQPGECVQVGSVYGGAWSMSASADFEGVVRSSDGSYAYGPTIGTSLGDNPAAGGNTFYSACNVCPGSGTITVDFGVPDPAIQGGAATTFQAQPTDTSACGSAALGGIGLDTGSIPVLLGGLGIVIAILVLLIVLALPAPRIGGPAAAAPRAPWTPKPKLVPVDWIQPVAGQAQIMASPGQPLVPNPGIAAGSIRVAVPRDAPQQQVAGYNPIGSRRVCPFCGQLTLTLFQQGWYCTNLQCPARRPGTGQRTEFVEMDM